MSKIFDKILIANRGEIALRIMKTCKEMGITTVAVYSEADKDALHTQYSDESYYIGPSPSPQSYLNIDKIISICKKSGVQAVHPGYGFLAENPDFARMCEQQNVTFIGPQSSTMSQAGDKITARKLAINAGIPVTPGSNEAVDDKSAKIIAREIGYPVLLKASAGGGGISMGLVEKEEDLLKALEIAQSSSLSAFACSDIFIEKYLTKPRHIEFQILADNYGNVIHLGERECSIQRRYQKLIEEAPSVIVDDKTRDQIGTRSVEMAKLTKYRNAGTIEYLFHEGEFYFNEINARLQVEHPVTELIMGVDIVKAQILIAAGNQLPYKQNDIKPRGWAMECRINAEDPYNNFLPSPGTVSGYVPPNSPGIRIDSGIKGRTEISSFYDSLLIKANTWGETRENTIARMRRMLQEFIIDGIETNIPFHLKVLEEPAFLKGQLDTNFIVNHGIVDKLTQEKTKHRSEMTRNAAIIAAAIIASEKGINQYQNNNQRNPSIAAVNKWKLVGRLEQLSRRL